jgi:hypothetical protein
MKNQIVWVGCIALVTVAVVGLFLTDTLILEKEGRQAVTDPPSTFTNPAGIMRRWILTPLQGLF